MFDKKGFIAFVGSASGNMYANGLANIEKTYNVDIDAEVARDNCVELFGLIDADKKQLSDGDLHARQNWSSHLKKYVDFKSKQINETEQKQRFVNWFKKQPQKNQPGKLYAEGTINAAANLLQSGLHKLGVPGYESTNCFTITDAEKFEALHTACYAAATEFDEKQRISDFRNGLDFYLQFLNETAGAGRAEMLKKLRFIIAHYKANFETVNKQERYKWSAIHWYKQHWDIDAPDFAKMLTAAFSKASNLLSSGMYYPYKMITDYANQNPEAVRDIFRTLHDEQRPFAERYQIFKDSCQTWIEQLMKTMQDRSKSLNHYQDPRAVLVYLTFQYPEKYYLFKSTMYSTFRDRVGFVEPPSKTKSVMQKIENYFQMCDVILEEVRKDSELLSMHKSRLDGNCYQDEALHLLTMDIVFYGSNYMSEDLFGTNDNYWPSLKDYNPGITKDMWISLLQDKTVTTEEVWKLLNMFLKLGGESSFNNLVVQFGNQFYYKTTLEQFSARITNTVNCAECPAEYKKYAQYIIPFVGRMVTEGEIKRDSWKLRDELKEALEDLTQFWPSLAEYDPKLTKEDWKKYILEVELPNHPQPMQMLKALMELNGQASCKRLAELYGGTPSHYVGCSVSLGRRAKKYFNLPACMDEGQERFFTIPFVGKRMLEGDKEYYVYRMRPELFAALKEIDLSGVSLYVTEEEETMDTKTDVGLNTILYGPPGTGKTYHTVIYAVAIIENKELNDVKAEAYQDVLNRYNEYKSQGRIEFTTFHQSYGYEEFIEGIRPSVVDEGDDTESGNIQYSIQPGMFKKFCEKADRPIAVSTNTADLGIGENATIWKVSLWGTGDNEIRSECLANGHIRIGWDQYGKDITDGTDFSADGGRVVLNAFINKMQLGDIIFSCYSASTIDAIGVVTGEYEWHDEYEELKRVRKVNWIVKGIRENILSLNGGTTMTLASVYKLSNVALSDVYKLIEKHQPTQQLVTDRKENYVFIIDEINRGNISKIFGELITLIEESKRVGKEEGMKTLLPYSMKPFGVPENVYIIGTMNTADRSIAAIDTALRRRFEFKEMLPDPDVVAKISVGNLSIKELLSRMNRRISVLYDREHTIGHAYFMPLAKDNSLEKLAEIFKNKVIPLLQEYFYEDYEKIRLVLADNQKKDERDQFILAKKINQSELFGSADIGLDDGFTYEINEDAFMNPDAYLQI